MPDYICEELISKIFTYLPVKSILCFRAVSKSICSFIGSPDFIRKHTFLSLQREKALIIVDAIKLKDHYTIHSDRLPLCPKGGDIDVVTAKFPKSYIEKIVGSCNGVFCVFDETNHTIKLWNPLIRRELTIRDLPSSGCKCSYVRMGYVRMGFGFDLVTYDYKILRISYAYVEKEKCSFIYTMKTGIWCKIDSPATPFENVVLQACCVNGTLHWVLVHRSNEPGDERLVVEIMTFDLGTNKFGLIALPKTFVRDIVYKDTTFQQTTINGSLAMMYQIRSGLCEIWMRRDSTASWLTLTINIYSHKNFWGLNTNNGEFLLLQTLEGYRIYNLETGSSQSEFKEPLNLKDGVSQLEISSLELLNTGTAYKGTHPSFLQDRPYYSSPSHKV